MKILEEFCFLYSDSCRSRAYIDVFLKNGYFPKYIINVKIKSVARNADREYFETHLYKNRCSIETISKVKGIHTVCVQAHSGINDKSILDSLHNIKTRYTIFSIPGRILSKEYFNLSTKYLHVHPGQLPKYRGSTPFYYSILNERKITATAFFLQSSLDQGPIITVKNYPLPSSEISLDLEYDPWIRASLLNDVINYYMKKNNIPSYKNNHEEGMDYYVIHPVLKCISINRIHHYQYK